MSTYPPAPAPAPARQAPLAAPTLPGGPQDRRTPSAVWHVAAMTVLTSTPVFLPGAAHALIGRELGWGEGRMGQVLALYWLGSLCGAWRSRRSESPAAAEKAPTRALLVTAGALMAMVAWPTVGLWLGALAGGAAYGYSQPHTNAWLMRTCPPGSRGVAFGVKQAAVPAATLVCSVAVPLLVVPFGWRSAWCVAAGLSAVLSLVVRRARPAAPAGPVPRASAGVVAPDRRLLALSAAGLFGAMVGNSLGGFLLVTLTDDGMTYTAGALTAAAASALTIVVRVTAGRFSDTGRGSAHAMMSLMFVAGVSGTCLLATGATGLQISGALLAFAGGWGWAGVLHYAAAVAFPGRENGATAWTQMGVSLGAMAGPLLFGVCYQAVGAAAWWVVSVAGGCALVAVLVARRPARPVRQEAVRTNGGDR
ncbi:MFS transporter [Streptomyces sp. NPDC091266]|uniref:MFS transporter n=1 Tax=Streptomyces sp. NPDC091266 TaxID=3365978 RepID=UPI003829DF5F